MIEPYPAESITILDKIRMIASEMPEDHAGLQFLDPLYWALSIGVVFGGQKFDLAGHEYQLDVIRDDHPNEVLKYSAQMTKTTSQILKRVHHLIYNQYPQGAMFIFPTSTLVQRFSQSRFTPLIAENPAIRRYVTQTDNISLKRVGRANLYFVGSRVTQKIEGEQKTSASLKSEPVDCIVEDEYDEIDQDMSELAQARMDHSKIKHRARTSTPTITGYGIDKAYEEESDQCVWFIKCASCGTETCLELEFPECLHEKRDHTVIRACKKCGREIFTRDGRWVARVPSKSDACRGRWISQLNSVYVDPAVILKEFRDPPNNNIGYVYNRRLGMAYIAAENRLTPNDLYPLLHRDLLPMVSHPGPTAMGVDVGNQLHVLIGDRYGDNTVRIVKMVRLSSFDDVHDLAARFNVKCAVFDIGPEKRKVMDYADAVNYEVFGCRYAENKYGTADWNQKEHVLAIDRTEVFDATHTLVTSAGRLMIHRMDDEVKEQFIPQVCSPVKILEEDDETGARAYRYKKRGPDHYRNALNYLYLASQRISVYREKKVQFKKDPRRDAYDEPEKEPGSWLGA